MRTASFCVVILCLSVLVAPGSAQDEAGRFERAFERLDEFINQQMSAFHTPGLAVALTSRHALLRVSTYGFADLKARVPVTPQTRFEIGSISKSFTAIALLQQREEGKFDPQAPVTKYLPWFQINSKYAPITGHHLLSHTAGIPRDRDDIPPSLYQAAGVRERWTGYAPGKKFNYSNIGFQILGYVLEEVAQQPYADLIRKRIFEPLGMSSSEAAITHETRKRLAVGYVPFYDDRPPHPSYPRVEATWLEYGAGDGSIAATPADLAAYLRMLLNRGTGPRGRILSEESFQMLIQPAIQTGEKAHYGYGLGVRQSDGHTIIAHGGGMVGYASMILGDLDDELGAVVFVNGPGNPSRVAEFALKVLGAALHNQDLPPLLAPDSPTQVANAAEYAGSYTTPDGKTLTLVAEREKLILRHNGEKIALERRGKDQFFVPDPEFALFLLRFGRDKEKVVEASHGADWYPNDRYSGPRRFEFPQEWLAYPGHYRTQDPWLSNFRIGLRKGKLWLMLAGGGEEELVPLEPRLFQIGRDETAERLRFDTVVNRKTLRANLSGVDFYRVFTP